MKQLYMVTYRYREGLSEDDLQKLTRKFLEVGEDPGTIAHYVRLDGKGGVILEEIPDDTEKDYENTLRYAPWIEFDVFPVTTIEDAFPVMARVFG